jgi:hypothetical protein
VEIELHASLISALDGGEWSASHPGRFIPQGKSPLYSLDRRLDGPQSQSGRGSEDKNSQPLSGLGFAIIQPVAQRYTTELFWFFLHIWYEIFCINKFITVITVSNFEVISKQIKVI